MNYEEDMYWTSDKIYENFDEWVEFVYLSDGIPVAAIYCMVQNNKDSEIFGIDLRSDLIDKHLVFKQLLKACMFELKNRQLENVSFFTEDEYENDTIDCGFKLIGKHVCYKIHFKPAN